MEALLEIPKAYKIFKSHGLVLHSLIKTNSTEGKQSDQNSILIGSLEKQLGFLTRFQNGEKGRVVNNEVAVCNVKKKDVADINIGKEKDALIDQTKATEKEARTEEVLTNESSEKLQVKE